MLVTLALTDLTPFDSILSFETLRAFAKTVNLH